MTVSTGTMLSCCHPGFAGQSFPGGERILPSSKGGPLSTPVPGRYAPCTVLVFDVKSDAE